MTHAGERVARVAQDLLADGPMGHDSRREDYRAFILRNFEDTPREPVFNSAGTNCAIFARGVCVQAGVIERGGRPKRTGITTWLGVRGFSEDNPDTPDITEGSWIPVEDLGENGEGLLTGDILFWTGYRGQRQADWLKTTNGHVAITLPGEGWTRRIAQGGGTRHKCAIAEPKDVRESWQRPLRGVWRPALIAGEPMPRPLHLPDTQPQMPAVQPTLRPGMAGETVREWQRLLAMLGYSVAADGVYGPKTEAVVKELQRDTGLPETGVADLATWRVALEPK